MYDLLNIMLGVSLSFVYTLGVPEKAERWIFSTLRAESVAYFYIIR